MIFLQPCFTLLYSFTLRFEPMKCSIKSSHLDLMLAEVSGLKTESINRRDNRPKQMGEVLDQFFEFFIERFGYQTIVKVPEYSQPHR